MGVWLTGEREGERERERECANEPTKHTHFLRERAAVFRLAEAWRAAHHSCFIDRISAILTHASRREATGLRAASARVDLLTGQGPG